MKKTELLAVFSVLALLVILIIFAATHRQPRHAHGEVTVYGFGGAELEHFADVGYERVGDMVIVYDGERTIRYLNCTIEVSE